MSARGTDWQVISPEMCERWETEQAASPPDYIAISQANRKDTSTIIADLCAEEKDAMYCTGQKSPNLNPQSTASPACGTSRPRKQQSLLVDIHEELSLGLTFLIKTFRKGTLASDVCGTRDS